MANNNDSLFKEFQRDPDICSNCFRRLRDRDKRNYRIEAHYNRSKREYELDIVDVRPLTVTIEGEEEEIGGYEDEIVTRPDNTVKIPERGAYRGMRTVCKCGFRPSSKGEWKHRPLDKASFFELAGHLRMRLDESGVNYCPDTFEKTLIELKSSPSEQFADDRMFDVAIRKAILKNI